MNSMQIGSAKTKKEIITDFENEHTHTHTHENIHTQITIIIHDIYIAGRTCNSPI